MIKYKINYDKRCFYLVGRRIYFKNMLCGHGEPRGYLIKENLPNLMNKL